MKRLILAASLAAIPAPSMAAFYAGNELLTYCSSKRPDEGLLCLGLVVGYYEGMQASYACKNAGPKVTAQQLLDVVVKFLNDNPAERHRSAVVLSFRAYNLAFDCRPLKHQ